MSYVIAETRLTVMYHYLLFITQEWQPIANRACVGINTVMAAFLPPLNKQVRRHYALSLIGFHPGSEVFCGVIQLMILGGRPVTDV